MTLRVKTLLVALLSATAIAGAAHAATTTTTYHTSTYSQQNYYNWNPFSTGTEGLTIGAQAGGTFPTDDDQDDDGVYSVSLGWQFHPMIRADLTFDYRNVDGDTGNDNIYDIMVNGYWDFKNDTRFTPYLGAGLGWAYSSDANESALAYQGIAGISFNINNQWALTAQYDYFDTTGFTYSANEVKGGVRYTF